MHTYTDRIQLEEDEILLGTVRKHWFILLRGALVPTLLFFAPVAAYSFIVNDPHVAALGAQVPQYDLLILYLFSLWGLITWMFLFLVWTDYYLDIWTITDRRIIAVDQRGLFRRTVASFRYERLQDVHIEIDGLIATFLDFGTLRAQTAGAHTEFKIMGVPDPRTIKAMILRAADHRAHKDAAV